MGKYKGVTIDEENGIIDTGIEGLLTNTGEKIEIPIVKTKQTKQRKKIQIHTSYTSKKLAEKASDKRVT